MLKLARGNIILLQRLTNLYFMFSVRLSFHLLLLLCITVTIHAQNDQSTLLNIGDPAPPLRVREWIKGTPVQRFEKDNVYVVEFWATWCKPCAAAMPHLSVLASKYKDKVTILGIDIYEKKNTSMEKVKAFVDSAWHRMDFHMAVEDSNFMETGWLDASGERKHGIPRSFVVDAEGRIAWIGYPKDLDEVLPKIVNRVWDINEALDKWNLDKYLAELDDSAREELFGYVGDAFKPGDLEGNALKPDDLGKPDSALSIINEMVRKEPRLKYAPLIAFYTFSFLLITDPHKAYEYGRVALATHSYDDPAYNLIIGSIESYSDKLDLPAEIYQLGAEAYQAEIDHLPYPEIVNLSNRYHKMAEWYWIANNKSKAIEAEQKAIESLKNEKDFSEIELAAFELRLQQYKNK